MRRRLCCLLPIMCLLIFWVVGLDILLLLTLSIAYSDSLHPQAGQTALNSERLFI